METQALNKLYDAIKIADLRSENYWIPSVWFDNNTFFGYSKVDPKLFFINRIENIFELSKNKSKIYKFPNYPLTYSMLIRYTTTFDHNQDNVISTEPIDGKFSETGTFLKTIAILPYLKKLGIDIIYLLPINEIGKHARKGNLGSPYACKHPFKLDPRLGEPFLNISLEEQFKAFVEACHLLDIKVVLEFVLRTASIDCDLALEHPEWFYWIKEEFLLNRNYQPPRFQKTELDKIIKKVEESDFANLIPPNEEYRNLFTQIPVKVIQNEDKVVGILKNGDVATIPSAFADWPPNDNQPLWTDVTYFRYYEHPEFNYISYNTIRMYSKELTTGGKKLLCLWEFISTIIPHFILNYDIDGAMIDMGHAIPNDLLKEIIAKSRQIKDDFIFWEENFSVTEKSIIDGYNATLGYMIFDQTDPTKLKEILSKIENHQFPLPFFLTPENHNTPRSGKFGCQFNELVYVFNSFLPGIRFVLSGFEWCHNLPYNTGLCFTEEEINEFSVDKLPLFSSINFKWGSDNIIQKITETNSIVSSHNLIFEDFQNYNVMTIQTTNSSVVCYSRSTKDFIFYILGNFSDKQQKFSIQNQLEIFKRTEILLGEFCLDNRNQIILQPYKYLVLKENLCSS